MTKEEMCESVYDLHKEVSRERGMQPLPYRAFRVEFYRSKGWRVPKSSKS